MKGKKGSAIARLRRSGPLPAHLVGEHDPRDSLGVPEELVDVVVSDDVLVVALTLEESAVRDLVALIADEAIERPNDGAKVEAFWYRFDAVLALGAAVVVVRTLEDEAKALGHEANLGGLSPAEEVEGELAHAVVARHLGHGLTPATVRRVESLDRGGCRGRLDAGLARGLASESAYAARVGLADGVVEVELSGKVPLAVVGVLSSDVVGVEGEEGLVGRHARGARVELDHEVVVHVAHRIALESELVGEVDEDVLDLLLGEGDLLFVAPGGVGLAQAGVRPSMRRGRLVVGVASRRIGSGAVVGALEGAGGRRRAKRFGRRRVVASSVVGSFLRAIV